MLHLQWRCLEHILPSEKVLIYAFLKSSCHDTKDGQRVTLCKCNAAQLKLEVTLLSLSLFLSFSPSLSKIDISSRWVRMIESWLWKYLLTIQWSMRAFWSAAGNALSLHHNLDGLSIHLSNSQALLSASAKTVFGLDQIKYERVRDGWWGNEGGREEENNRDMRSHPLAPLIFSITAKPHSDIWPHSSCCSLCSLTVSLLHPSYHLFCTLFILIVYNTWHLWIIQSCEGSFCW